jgi:hypothetical protein
MGDLTDPPPASIRHGPSKQAAGLPRGDGTSGPKHLVIVNAKGRCSHSDAQGVTMKAACRSWLGEGKAMDPEDSG